MARYKDYKQDDTLFSLRVKGIIDSQGNLSFKYVGILRPDADDEVTMPFNSAEEGEKYIKKLGFKEY